MKRNTLTLIKTLVLFLALITCHERLGAQCPNAITNGNFENGLTGWETFNNFTTNDHVITTSQAIEGSFSALVGYFNTNQFPWANVTYMGTDIDVPAQGGILSFDYVCSRAGYTSASTQFAYICAPQVLFPNASQIYDTLLYQVWGNGSGSVSINLAKYAGRRVALRFDVDRVQNGSTENSSNYTSVSIKVDRVVLSTKTSIIRYDECQLGFSHAVGNHVYTNYGTYYDTINQVGCDSIITTYITKKYGRANQHINYCLGSAISTTIGTHTYTAPGTYVDTLYYPNNCDSILTTTIAYYPDPKLNRAYSSCGNFTFNSGNIVHTVSGAGVHYYSDTLWGASVFGCDSVINTEVTINTIPAPAAQVANRVLCNGQTSSKIAFNLPDNTTFTKWHSSNPAIGLKAMGVDTIPQFVAINNSSIPIIDTITVVVKGRGIAWIPSGNMMYKYDLSTKAVVDSATIPGGKIVHTVAFDHTGSTVYAAGITSDFINDRRERKIFSFSASTGEFLRDYNIIVEVMSEDFRPIEGNMCVSPDDRYLYLTASSRPSGRWHFEKIELATGVITLYDSLYGDDLNKLHGHMCFSPDKSKLYIGTATTSGITEYNMPGFTYSRTLNSVSLGYSLICSPDGKRLFIGRGYGGGSPSISVIDIGADTLITTLTVPPFYNNGVEGAFSYTPDSTRLIVCYTNSLQVMPGANASRFYSYDINTYQIDNLGGQYGRLPNYNSYEQGIYFHNGFVTPDGRDMVIHEPNIFNNGYFGMMYRKLGSTGAFTNANTSLRNNLSNTSGSFGDLVDVGHCESQVMTFTITVNPTKFTNQVTICSGDTFNVGSKRYTASGTYVDTLQGVSIYGCDSIVTTILTVTPSVTSYQAFNYCGSGSVTVGNVTHTSTGYYIDTLQAAASTGCDSIVFTNLIINPLPTAPNVTVSNQAGCPGATIAATNLGSGSNGNSIVWNGTTNAIGLAATGATTVPAFTALNNTNSAITDTISVTTTATGYAYVANPNFSYVAVVNRQTNTVVTNIGSLSGASGVAVSPNGSRVYVSGLNVNTVSVINASTNTVSNTISVGTQPFNVAVNPAGNRVYAANNGSNNVSVVDTLTNTVIATIPVRKNPRGIAVHPDGKRVYVANSGSDTVSVINTVTNTVVAEIAVGDNPFALVINATGNRVYVANFTAGTVSVINAENNTLITNITVGSTARGIAITPDGARLYVTDFLGNTVYVINTATNTVITTIAVGNRPSGVSVSADGTRAYVTNTTGPTMSVISTATNTVVATVGGLSGPDTQGSFISGSGCSSTPVKYNITVFPKPQYTQEVDLCTGSSITVGTHTYSTTGVYTDTLPNASVSGCDSIVITQLTMHSPATSTVNETICQGSNYAGHTTSGTYIDHYSTVYGCDSARTLNLTVNPIVTTTLTLAICQGSNYAGYTTSGTYVDHYTAVNGCDSARTLNLTVNPNVSSIVNASICQGGSYAGHTASGTYIDHYTSAAGCDSTRTLNLVVNQPSSSTTNITICQSQLPYSWSGLTFNAAGTQTQTGLVNAAGCDSSATLNLTVNESINSVTNVSVCRAALPYTWNGLTFTDAGSQTATGYTSVTGCDSTATLNLTVNDTSHEYFNYSICESAMPLAWNNIVITAPGTYTKTGFTNIYGCDSSITMYFTTRPGSSSVTNLTICEDELPYTWSGLVFTGSGTQTKTGLQNAVYCDSTATLNLTVIPTTSVTNITVCPSQLPYIWNGLTFSGAGTQTATGFTNINGCDSNATLILTVNSIVNGTDVQTACGSYTWIDGNTYSASNNTATYTLTGSNGCDSVVALNLTINNPTTGTDVQTACGSYIWIDGNTYNANNNTATYTLTGSNGCDSVVALNLTINNPTTGTDVQTACGSYIWIDGNTYNANNNTATYTLTGSNGCDSVVALNLTINNPTTGTDVQTACGSYTWIDGNTYSASNNTATYTLTGSNGCDSVVTLNLQITALSNQVTVSGATCTAVESNAAYQWIDCNNNQPVADATAQTFTAMQNGSYSCIIEKGGCTDSTDCVNVTTIGIINPSAYFFKIFPNPTTGAALVEHNYAENATIVIIDALGRTVEQLELQPAITTLNISRLAAGVYNCSILSNGEQLYKQKIIKE